MKRVLDIVICLILLLPSLLIVGLASLSILVFDGRPVFFTHYRAGENGKLFLLPKLRTLSLKANPYKPLSESPNEYLVTSIGRSLRKYRFDELPQLFSVIVGSMTLVGPRPEMPNIVESYCSFDRKRLHARPGITGLWQIMSDRKSRIHQNLKYDLYYLRKASLWLDLKILFLTIPFLLNQK